jgi:hypothetical protein
MCQGSTIDLDYVVAWRCLAYDALGLLARAIYGGRARYGHAAR